MKTNKTHQKNHVVPAGLTTVIRVAFSLLAVIFLAGCTDPFAQAAGSGKASLTVTVATSASRTLVPDFTASITSCDITLSSQDGFSPRIASGVAANHTFENIEAGTWDVAVTAYAGSTVVASGTALAQDIAAGTSATVNVNLVPAARSGTGHFSLKMRVPSSTGIDGLYWRLEAADGALVCDNLVSAATEGLDKVFTATNTQAPAATYTGSTQGISAGTYTLVLGFTRSGVAAGTFREAVNIWGGLTSDKWIKTDGSLAVERAFSAVEFFDHNTGLAVFRLSGNSLTADVPASASATPLNLGLVRTLMLGAQVQAGYAGQSISYRWNAASASEAWIPVASTVSAPTSLPSLTLKSGANTLELKVTAADRMSSETYTVTMSSIAIVTGSSAVAMEMVKISGGTFQRNATAANTSTVGSFLMGRYPVTQGQYQSVTGSSPSYCSTIASGHVSTENANRPVETVNWYEAAEFCNKLSQLEGLESVYTFTNRDPASGYPINSATVTADISRNGYRLPTWTEMVWMAHSAYNQELPGGNTHAHAALALDHSSGSADQVWYASQSVFKENAEIVGTDRATVAVGTMKPNVWGVYDMFGLVALWLHDFTDMSAATLGGGSGATRNESGLAAGAYHPQYGGSIYFANTDVNLAYLINGFSNNHVTNVDRYTGFRVARSLPHRVVYQSSGASSGTPPVDVARYLEGSLITVKDNTGNQMRGPLIQDGITQRFLGWSRTSGAVAPDADLTAALLGAATPVSLTMGSADLVLYPVWSTTTAANTTAAMVGMIGPAGGWVFYDNGSVNAEGWRYLECASVDQSSTAPWSPANYTLATLSGFGKNKGGVNTLAIIAKAGAGTYAAQLCNDLVLGGYGDWYLPTVDELKAMKTGLFDQGTGKFADGQYYWSSEYGWSGNVAYNLQFAATNTTPSSNGSYQTQTVFFTRAVRCFSAVDVKVTIRFMDHATPTLSAGTLPAYDEGQNGMPMTIPDNANNSFRGPAIQDGITQRLRGWTTVSGSTTVVYTPGQVIARPQSDLVLFPVWTSVAAANTANAMLGMVGPAQGWVFKDLGAVGSEGWRYLEASPADLAKGGIPWAATVISMSGTTDTGGASSFRGNTEKLVAATAAQAGTNAARLCSAYSVNGYSDWYLPAPNELLLMRSVLYSASPSIGHFNEGLPQPAYWSSQGNSNPVYFNFSTGLSASDWAQTTTSFGVRAVRAFRNSTMPLLVRYDANGATGGTVPGDYYCYLAGNTVTVLSNPGSLVKTGYTFQGWNTAAYGEGTSYAAGASFDLGTSDATLYAQWGNIVISGVKENNAGYWKDGVWTDLGSGRNLALKYSGTDIVSVGTYYNGSAWQGAYWVGTSKTTLSISGHGSAVSLDIYGGQYRLAGYYRDLAGTGYYRSTYIGSTRTDSTSTGTDQQNLCIAMDGSGNQWVGGFTVSGPKLEKNGVAVTLPGSSDHVVNSVAVNGTKIIAVGAAGGGYNGTSAVYWESTDSGASFSGPYTLWSRASGGTTNCFAKKVAFNGTDWYVVGTDGLNAVYSIDGPGKVVLAGQASPVSGKTASGIAFGNGNTYICGYDSAPNMGLSGANQGYPLSRNAYLWINGFFSQTLASSTDQGAAGNQVTMATDIIFVP